MIPCIIKTEYGWEVWFDGRFLGTYPTREWADQIAEKAIADKRDQSAFIKH